MTKETKICIQCRQPKKMESARKTCTNCVNVNRLVKEGKARLPDYDEVNTAGFKEPMQKVEHGFGYYGAITTTNDQEMIQCHVCGYYFSKLAMHTRTHKLTAKQYRITYGLRVSTGLTSPAWRARAQVVYNTKVRLPPGHHAKMVKNSVTKRKAMKAEGVKFGGDHWSPQQRNEKGNCREQTLAKIKHVADLCGGQPNMRVFLQEYGNGSMGTVRHWFGTWDAGVILAGFKPYREVQKEQADQLRGQTIKLIQRFYQEYGRTPSSSDFDSCEYLPGQAAVAWRFGSVNHARQAAGVPLIVYADKRWIEVDASNIDLLLPKRGSIA